MQTCPTATNNSYRNHGQFVGELFVASSSHDYGIRGNNVSSNKRVGIGHWSISGMLLFFSVLWVGLPAQMQAQGQQRQNQPIAPAGSLSWVGTGLSGRVSRRRETIPQLIQIGVSRRQWMVFRFDLLLDHARRVVLPHGSICPGH